MAVPPDYTEETIDAVRDRIHEVMVDLVEHHVRIIVYFGNAKIGLEICREGKKRELRGERYAYVGAMWINENTQEMLKKHPNREDI